MEQASLKDSAGKIAVCKAAAMEMAVPQLQLRQVQSLQLLAELSQTTYLVVLLPGLGQSV
jgi:hypothetical protein